MQHPIRAAATIALLAAIAVPSQANGGFNPTSQACIAKARGPYGFQCSGLSQVVPGAGLEPVTFIGTVAADAAGVYQGRGTFNSSSFGAVRNRVVGQASFGDRCIGNISYRVFVLLPDGSDGPELPRFDIDFTVVAGGDEILGTPTAAPGVTGPAVPRMSCRLVKLREN